MSKVLTVSDAFFAEMQSLVASNPPVTTSPPPVTQSPPPPPAMIVQPTVVNGWNILPMNLTWVNGNMRLHSQDAGLFSNKEMLLVKFTTPNTIGDSATIQVVQSGGQPEAVRVMTLATIPYQIADKYIPTSAGFGKVNQPIEPILGSTTGVAPVLTMKVGGLSTLSSIGLKPSTTYFLTLINRNGFGGTPSCTKDTCGVDINFVN